MLVHTKGKGCKYMAAIEHLLLISSEASLGKMVHIKKQCPKCPGCKKKRFVKDGWYHARYGNVGLVQKLGPKRPGLLPQGRVVAQSRTRRR